MDGSVHVRVVQMGACKVSIFNFKLLSVQMKSENNSFSWSYAYDNNLGN